MSTSVYTSASTTKHKLNIGVMGGMFDPVHQGHLQTALTAQQRFGLDRLHLVPCGSPVHRRAAIATDADRLAMLQLAVAGHDNLTVDDRECRVQGASYTFDTLAAIKAENSNCRLFFILGVDAFNTLPTWHRWRDILDLAHLLVVVRPGWEIDLSPELDAATRERLVTARKELQSSDAGKLMICRLASLMVSSSQVRDLLKVEQVKVGHPLFDVEPRHNIKSEDTHTNSMDSDQLQVSPGKLLQEILPDKVQDYIINHNLYEATGV